MDHRNAADVYRRASFENAPPIKIVRMLYQGALRFLDQAVEEDPRDPSSQFSDLVCRVDAITSELRMAIDHTQSPEVSADLERLYYFVEERLGHAALDRTIEPLGDARRVLGILLDAWNQVEITAASKVA